MTFGEQIISNLTHLGIVSNKYVCEECEDAIREIASIQTESEFKDSGKSIVIRPKTNAISSGRSVVLGWHVEFKKSES